MGYRAAAIMETRPGGGLQWPIGMRVAVYTRWMQGEIPADLARAFNLPISTVQAFVKDPEVAAMCNPAHALTEKKVLPARFIHTLHRSLDRVTDDKLDACTAPQLMLIAGIAADKAQVLDSVGLRGVTAKDTLTSVLREVENIRIRRLELDQPMAEVSENV